uniref:Uncharacterized protein n=1 Tax=Octopus bimaculoides TaxID=37653 RepID=A0A0L8G8N6_OCTBM
MMQKTLIIFAFLLFVTAMSSVNGWTQPPDCGPHNQFWEICCNSHIVPKRHWSNNACCGYIPYTSSHPFHEHCCHHHWPFFHNFIC